MAKIRTYYGVTNENGHIRNIFAQVTGQMVDGTMIYTEIATREDGSAIKENGEYKLILGNQYTRTLKGGWQEFFRL